MFRKFFPRNEDEIVEGAPFLQGKYPCSHCGEPHAQWGRFTLEGALSFCTPECAAAYNIFQSSTQGQHERHQHLEAQCGRRVEPVISRKQMTQMRIGRDVWLKQARATLSPHDWKCIEREMVVVVNPMKKRL